MADKKIKMALVIVIVIAIIAIIIAVIFKPTPGLPKSVNIETKNQPTMGNPNAPIEIVVFEDLKCFNCRRFNLNVLPTIKKKYINTGKAKYTVINLAFIPGSMPAANAARCLYEQNPKYFFAFVKYIYENQPPEEQNWATVPTLLEYANHIPGINQNKFERCVINMPYTEFIKNNLKMASKIMGETVATPAVYVNGRVVQPLTIEQIEKVIKAVQ